eukprot:8023002-Pyramimonas_sp.AAC.1
MRRSCLLWDGLGSAGHERDGQLHLVLEGARLVGQREDDLQRACQVYGDHWASRETRLVGKPAGASLLEPKATAQWPWRPMGTKKHNYHRE